MLGTLLGLTLNICLQKHNQCGFPLELGCPVRPQEYPHDYGAL